MYKILIADDEVLERKSLHIFFERNFPELIILPDAENGSQVIETVLHQKPDVLILDIEMPGLNGLEALKIIRHSNTSLKVIVKTAYSKFTYAKEALNLHVDYFLLKPVKKEEMKECIMELLTELQTSAEHTSTLNNDDSISKIALLSSILHKWAGQEEICLYAQRLKINYTCGFMITLAFPNMDNVDIPALVDVLTKNLSLTSDFIIGAFENGILPIMIFYSASISGMEYEKNRQELSMLINSWITSYLEYSSIVSCGRLVADDIMLIYDSYQDALKQLKNLPDNTIMNSSGNESLQRAIIYIREHYYEDLSLDVVAEHIKMNPSYLSHLFKENLHKNYTDYLNEYRITQSIRFMQEGIVNVNELSERVGYTYSSYFCKLFKKYTGHTISNFKKEL